MLKKQWKEYFLTGRMQSLRPMLVYIEIFILPVYIRLVILGKDNFSWKGAIGETVMVIAFLLVALSEMTHPIRPGKMYYLCPRSREERLREIRDAYHFRCGMHLIVMSVMCGTLYLMKGVNVYSAGYIFLNGILASFLSQVSNPNKSMLLNLFLTPAIIMGSFFQFALPTEKLQKEDIIFLICCAVFFLIAILPAFRAMKKCIDREIETAAVCEEVQDHA